MDRKHTLYPLSHCLQTLPCMWHSIKWKITHLIHLFVNVHLALFPQFYYFFLIFIYYLFIYLWLCWVFVSVRGLSLVAASGGHSSSRCTGFSLSRPLLLRSTGSRRAGSVVVAHGPSCSTACGIFSDQGSNPCPLHWQADSQPLRHQGSPPVLLFINFVIIGKWWMPPSLIFFLLMGLKILVFLSFGGEQIT